MNKNEPLISVIIPLYNAEKYIAETIQSVINQTYTNWELLVVDDCSTDTSRDIVREYESKDNRIKLIESESNFGGPARPRNIGLENVKGEYIAFLDADDVWLPQKLDKQLKFLRANPNMDICHTLANVINENSEPQGFFDNQKAYNKLKPFISQKNILFYMNNININSTLMRSNSELKFEEDKNLIAVEDWNLWIKLIKNEKKVVLLNEKLLNYRIHNASISNRNTDVGYRKSLYLLSLIFLRREIPMRHYIFSSMLQVVKIVIKKFK